MVDDHKIVLYNQRLSMMMTHYGQALIKPKMVYTEAVPKLTGFWNKLHCSNQGVPE
jgi:hypothetical protein